MSAPQPTDLRSHFPVSSWSSEVEEGDEKKQLLPQEAVLQTSASQHRVEVLQSSEANQQTTHCTTAKVTKWILLSFGALLIGGSSGLYVAALYDKVPFLFQYTWIPGIIAGWWSLKKANEVVDLQDPSVVESFKRFYRTKTFESIYHSGTWLTLPFSTSRDGTPTREELRNLNLPLVREFNFLSIEELRKKFCYMVQTKPIKELIEEKPMLETAAVCEILTSEEFQMLTNVDVEHLDSQKANELREALIKSMVEHRSRSSSA